MPDTFYYGVLVMRYLWRIILFVPIMLMINLYFTLLFFGIDLSDNHNIDDLMEKIMDKVDLE